MASTAVAVKNPGLACSASDCELRASARGLCVKHYKKWKAANTPCRAPRCHRNAAREGYCRGHWDRWKKYGDPLAGPPIRDRAPNGAPRPVVTQGGYVLVWSPDHPNAQANGYVLEHVKVMTDDLGRPLRRGENVHHANGVRNDNRRENLELWVSMQPTGQRPADLVRYALEILERYGSSPDDARRTGGVRNT